MINEDPLIPTSPSPPTFRCPKCGNEFASENALRMHHMRVHTTAGRRGAMWKKRIKTKKTIPPSQTKERKREYYLRHKSKMHARGLNAHGQPFKSSRPTKRKVPMFVYTGEPERQAMPIRGHINFCPKCGENIERYEKLTTTEE